MLAISGMFVKIIRLMLRKLRLSIDLFQRRCFDFTTTVQYMSTKVYPMVGTELGLTHCLRKEFATVYTFSPDFARYPKAFQSRPLTALEEIVGAEK